MFLLDLANTAFITLTRMYCYNVIPFGLKNVTTSYQCMMSLMFEPLMGKSMEVYIDDMLVKSQSREDHLAHLREAFSLIILHHLWLNPDKCAFKVESEKFLVFLVSKRGIEMVPEQSTVVLQMQPPKNRKQIRSMTGKLAVLNRFIFRYSDLL